MAGSIMKYTVQEANNAALGQAGSVFLSGANATATAPPTGTAFVAITIIEDSEFKTTTGLVPEEGTGRQYVSSGSGSDSKASGDSDAVTVATTFPAGLTIYGRWSSIDLNDDSFLIKIL